MRFKSSSLRAVLGEHPQVGDKAALKAVAGITSWGFDSSALRVPVAQLAEATGLDPVRWGFESLSGYNGPVCQRQSNRI